MRCPLFIIIFLFALISSAQIEVTVIDHAASHDELVDPSVAVNPKDNKQIVIGAAPDKVYFTDDGGLNWNMGEISFSMGATGNPVVLTDKKGRFYLLHRSSNDLIVTQMSKDGGRSWSEQGTLSVDESKMHVRPGATISDKGRLMAVWTQQTQNDDGGTSDVFLSFSSNGSKWGSSTKLNKAPGQCCESNSTVMGAKPVVYNEDRYFIIWAHDEKIYLDRSLDGGKFWLKNEDAVMQQPGGWKFEIPGLKEANGLPSFMVFFDPRGYFNGRLLLLWSDQKNGPHDTEIRFAYSDNRGDSFQPSIRINDDETGRHQFYPAMTIDQSTGMIYVLYYDRRNSSGLETEVYIAYSKDGGLSFQNRKLSKSSFTLPKEGVSLGDYISISAAEGKIAAAWTAYDEGRTEIRAAVFDHEELEK